MAGMRAAGVSGEVHAAPRKELAPLPSRPFTTSRIRRPPTVIHPGKRVGTVGGA